MMKTAVIDKLDYSQMLKDMCDTNYHVFSNIDDKTRFSFQFLVNQDLDMISDDAQSAYAKKFKDFSKKLLMLSNDFPLFRVQLDYDKIFDNFPLTIRVDQRIRDRDASEYLMVKALKPKAVRIYDTGCELTYTTMFEYCFYYDKSLAQVVVKTTKSVNSKLIPVSVNDRRFFKIIKLVHLEKYFFNKTSILKDVLRLRDSQIHVPLSIEYVLQFHNLQEMWQNKFHNEAIGKAVNHQFLIDTYVMYHLSKHLDLGYYRKLSNRVSVFTKTNNKAFFNVSYFAWDYDDQYGRLRTGSLVWLQKVLALAESLRFVRNPKDSDDVDEVSGIIFDLFRLETDLKLPLKISATKFKGLIREHDALVDDLSTKRVKLRIKLPAWSQKLLDFVDVNNTDLRILDTSVLLAHEGIAMHNCVGTYGSLINQGICVVFHYFDGKIACTVEIQNIGRSNKPQYVLAQIYQACNVDAPKNVVKKIKNVLETVNKL